ncbi:MAG: hypothetical protein GXO74_11995 [Calditrichaeota bacterium]|nr:hypothetical protein [Calditrichota bacterium]
MTPRERINRAMQRKIPDRVPVWCPLSLEHIVRNGREDGKFPETVEEFVEIECQLTLRYGFDGVLLYLPMLKKGTAVAPILDNLINNPPVGDSSHDFQTADPEKWELPDLDFTEENFYSAHLAREIIGEKYHLGGWVGDGFSKALQWFPVLDDALIALLEDAERFKAIVRYFDKICVAQAKAQIELGRLESIHISSPYAGSSFISLPLYRELVFDSVRCIALAVKEAGGFSYLHTCGSISDRLEVFAETGVDGIECMDLHGSAAAGKCLSRRREKKSG